MATSELPAFTFDEAKHEYTVNGMRVPGCTSILHTGGLVPRFFVDNEYLERRSALGREVHKACHLHNLGTLGSYDKAVKPHLHAWIAFKEQKKFVPRLSEHLCVAYVNGMGFGMQLDCEGLLDGEEAIIDYKIGEVYPHHAIQTAGYAAGLPHAKYTTPMARFLKRKRFGVQLRETGVPKIVPFDLRSDYEAFVSALYVTAWKRRNEKFYREMER
jgi:hypothetical protein